MSLDTVIRKVVSEKEKLDDELLVIIDVKTGKALDKIPGFWRGFTATQLYAVSNVRSATCVGINYRFGDTIVKVSYKVNCISDKEKKAVEALISAKDISLDSALNNHIRRIIKRYADEQQYHSMLPKSIDDFKRYIKRSAEDELALNLIPTTEIDGQDIDRIASGSFEVRVEEFPIAVSFELEYETVDWNKRTTNETDYASLNKGLIRLVEDFVLSEANLHNWAYHFDGKVKPKLRQLFVEKLAGLGLHIRHFTFTNATIGSHKPKDELTKIATVFNCKIEEHNELIQVDIEVNLKLQDLGKFKKANIPKDFKVWYEQELLSPVVEGKLFKKNYKDFLINIQNIKREIIDEIEKRTENIGYHVEHHVFFPRIPKLKMVDEGFHFEDIAHSFRTKDNNVQVPLVITVKGRLESLKDLEERFLHPRVDLEAEIRKVVVDSVSTVMYKEEAEEVYMHFEYNANNLPTVREKVVAAITKSLLTTFYVNNSSLTVLVGTGQNRLSIKISELMATEYRFEIEFLPEISLTGHTLDTKYAFTFKVTGVRSDGWVTIQTYEKRSSADEVTAVIALLKERIAKVLSEVTYDKHIAASIDKQLKLQLDAGIQAGFAAVGQQFGLNLSIQHWERKRNLLEEVEAQRRAEDIRIEGTRPTRDVVKEIDDMIKTLQIQLARDIAEGNLDEFGIDEIKKKIIDLMKLKSELGPSDNMLFENKQQRLRLLSVTNPVIPSSPKPNIQNE